MYYRVVRNDVIWATQDNRLSTSNHFSLLHRIEGDAQTKFQPFSFKNGCFIALPDIGDFDGTMVGILWVPMRHSFLFKGSPGSHLSNLKF